MERRYLLRPATGAEHLAAPDRHPRVPDVSYAGHHRGERRWPRSPARASVAGFDAVGTLRGGVPPGDYAQSTVVSALDEHRLR